MESGRLRVVAAVCLLWVALYASWLAVRPGGSESLRLFSDIAYLVPLAAAAVAALVAARVGPRDLRVFWVFVGLGCTTWLAGEVLWSARDLVAGSVPFPWWTDALYMWLYPLLGLGLVLALRPQLGSVGVGRLLDAALAVGSFTLVWWWLVLSPLALSFDLDSIAALGGPALALPLLGLLVAIRLLPRRQGTFGTSLVGAGLLAGAVTDGIYASPAMTSSYLGGSWIEVGWQVEALLYAAGALVTVLALEDAPDWTRVREPDRPTCRVVAGATATMIAGLAVAAASGALTPGPTAVAAALVVLGVARAVCLRRAPERPQPAAAFRGKLGSLRLHDELSRLIERGRFLDRPVAFVLADTDALLDPGAGLEQRLAACARDEDGVLDLGSGRFGLLLPDADEAAAARVAADVRRELALAGRAGSVASAVALPGDRAETVIARARTAALG